MQLLMKNCKDPNTDQTWPFHRRTNVNDLGPMSNSTFPLELFNVKLTSEFPLYQYKSISVLGIQ